MRSIGKCAVVKLEDAVQSDSDGMPSGLVFDGIQNPIRILSFLRIPVGVGHFPVPAQRRDAGSAAFEIDLVDHLQFVLE